MPAELANKLRTPKKDEWAPEDAALLDDDRSAEVDAEN